MLLAVTVAESVPHAVPAAVTAAAAALAEQQERVAGLLGSAAARDAWAGRLRDDQRLRLVRLGHFPLYAAELDWTPREVAGHLRDSARVFTDRIRRIRVERSPALADFVTDAPDRLADYRSTAPGRLLEQLHEAQAQLLTAVREVGDADLDRSGVHETDGAVTVAQLLVFLPDHQRDHAEQLAALVPGLPPTG